MNKQEFEITYNILLQRIQREKTLYDLSSILKDDKPFFDVEYLMKMLKIEK